MDTTLNPKSTDPRHILVARAEEEVARKPTSTAET
jgi:hypothetical protein